MFPKGGQPANQLGNGVFLKKKTLPTTPSSLKKHCRPILHPFKKLISPHLRKNRAGIVLRRWPVLFTPNHNNPGLQKFWEKTRVWRRVGGVSDLNINKWNQSTLFSRMIDFWKTDILTKWHIPYVTKVGRRQFNFPISSEMVIFLPGHSSSLKTMIHSNSFAVGQTRNSCSFRFLCARLHTVIIRFLHLIFAKMRQPFC